MSKLRRRRLRISCESALDLAEWRLADERRRAAAERAKLLSPPAKVRRRPSLVKLSLLWILVGALVLLAIKVSAPWVDKPVVVDVGFWLVALVALIAAAVIVLVVLALTYRRPKTR